jgi:hypothetical protein
MPILVNRIRWLSFFAVVCVAWFTAVVGAPVTVTKEPKLLLNDNNAGKPEGMHLMIGRRPYAAFGNSTGDRQMR